MKEEAFEVSEVVNWLLSRYDSNQFSLTNLKLNKLVYFLHGVSLARHETALVRNRFECWQNGPVVASLYHRLKKFGNKEVTEFMQHQNYETGVVEPVSIKRVEAQMPITLLRAADYFAAKSSGWLVKESHAENGPWFRNYAGKTVGTSSVALNDLEIKEHFANIYGGKALN